MSKIVKILSFREQGFLINMLAKDVDKRYATRKL